MPFELTETQKHIVEAAKKISSKFDDSYWLDLDLKSEFPSKFYDEVAKSGWLGTVSYTHLTLPTTVIV